MMIQPIHYAGRLAAAATRSRFFLCEELRGRPADDPERTFVIYMCAYAGDVLSGHLVGKYSDVDARAYARACLIPGEFAERPDIDVERASRALGVPARELRVEQVERLGCQAVPFGMSGNAPDGDSSDGFAGL